MISETEPVPDGHGSVLVESDKRLMLSEPVRIELAAEFERLSRELNSHNPNENAVVDLDRARAAQVLGQIHKEVDALGEVPDYVGQKELISRVLDGERVTGLGEWKIAVKYAALLAIHLVRSRYIRSERD